MRDKTFNIAKNPKYDWYQRSLASLLYNIFDKKTLNGAVKSEIMPDQRPSDLAVRQLVKELHKPIIRKFWKRKVHSHFVNNIWVAALANMQLISKLNKEFRILVCVIDIYSKNAWVDRFLKDKKVITITKAFQKILD